MVHSDLFIQRLTNIKKKFIVKLVFAITKQVSAEVKYIVYGLAKVIILSRRWRNAISLNESHSRKNNTNYQFAFTKNCYRVMLAHLRNFIIYFFLLGVRTVTLRAWAHSTLNAWPLGTRTVPVSKCSAHTTRKMPKVFWK